jgi:hypothetical protein
MPSWENKKPTPVFASEWVGGFVVVQTSTHWLRRESEQSQREQPVGVFIHRAAAYQKVAARQANQKSAGNSGRILTPPRFL